MGGCGLGDPKDSSKRPEPVRRNDMVERVVIDRVADVLVQVADFDAGSIRPVQVEADTGKYPVLGETADLAPIRRVQIEKHLVPDNPAATFVAIDRLGPFTELPKSPPRLRTLIPEPLFQSRTGHIFSAADRVVPDQLLPEPVFIKDRPAVDGQLVDPAVTGPEAGSIVQCITDSGSHDRLVKTARVGQVTEVPVEPPFPAGIGISIFPQRSLGVDREPAAKVVLVLRPDRLIQWIDRNRCDQ